MSGGKDEASGRPAGSGDTLQMKYNKTRVKLEAALVKLEAARQEVRGVQVIKEKCREDQEKCREVEEECRELRGQNQALGTDLRAQADELYKLQDLVESGREREQDLLKRLERAHRDLAEMAAQRKKEKDSAESAQKPQAEVAQIDLSPGQAAQKKKEEEVMEELLQRCRIAESNAKRDQEKMLEMKQEINMLKRQVKEAEEQRQEKPIHARDVPTYICEKVPRSLARGLPNVGNTCWLNSILQCFVHTPGIFQQNWPEAGSVPCMPSQVGALLDNYFRAVKPMNNVLQGLLQLLGNMNKEFKKREEQHDAQEALGYILDGLEKHIPWLKIAFKLTKQVKRTCKSCSKGSEELSTDRWLGLPLATSTPTYADEVKELGEVNVQKLVDKHICSRETIEGACEHCKATDRQLWSTETLSSSSDLLVVQLLRFVNYRDAGGEYQAVKVRRRVHMQSVVNLPNGARYKLHGIVSHSGESHKGGHYVATVRDLLSEKWIDCNDDRVQHAEVVDGLPVVNSGFDPYMLFYHRAK